MIPRGPGKLSVLGLPIVEHYRHAHRCLTVDTPFFVLMRDGAPHHGYRGPWEIDSLGHRDTAPPETPETRHPVRAHGVHQKVLHTIHERYAVIQPPSVRPLLVTNRDRAPNS